MTDLAVVYRDGILVPAGHFCNHVQWFSPLRTFVIVCLSCGKLESLPTNWVRA